MLFTEEKKGNLSEKGIFSIQDFKEYWKWNEPKSAFWSNMQNEY